MKIRSGFVTNSSSTSFLLIADGDLDQKSFFSLMGIDSKSPLTPLFNTLYEAILENTHRPVDFSQADTNVPVQNWFSDFRDELTPRILEKLEDARRRGFKVYFGQLSTQSSDAECFFCTDSFEVENDKIYFNALECVY